MVLGSGFKAPEWYIQKYADCLGEGPEPIFTRDRAEVWNKKGLQVSSDKS